MGRTLVKYASPGFRWVVSAFDDDGLVFEVEHDAIGPRDIEISVLCERGLRVDVYERTPEEMARARWGS